MLDYVFFIIEFLISSSQISLCTEMNIGFSSQYIFFNSFNLSSSIKSILLNIIILVCFAHISSKISFTTFILSCTKGSDASII